MFQFAEFFVLCTALLQVSALFGGRNANVGEYPAFVGIVLPFDSQVCGGSIFNRNHVLTVANRMLSTNFMLLAPNQLSIISGANTINFAMPRVQVQAVYVHPQFNPFTSENDIAVVRTQTDFNFPQVAVPLVAPIDLSTRIAFDTLGCWVTAWNTNNNLQQTLAVPIINRDTCNALAPNFGRISESMMCAGTTAASTGVCNFNRGASLYCNNRLEGVLSSGFSCGTVANTPGVYTQVRFYQQWIEEQVRRQDIPPANVSPIERLP